MLNLAGTRGACSLGHPGGWHQDVQPPIAQQFLIELSSSKDLRMTYDLWLFV